MPSTTMQQALLANGDRSQFRQVADDALARFQATIAVHVDAVRAKEMHPDKARGSLKLHAEKFRDDLASLAKSYSSTPAIVSSRISASANRLATRREANYDVHAENGKRLDANRLEVEVSNRRDHFRARALRADLSPGNEPTARGLLAFLEKAKGDAAAELWARRELAEQAELAPDPAMQGAIAEALRDPSQVHDDSVEAYLRRILHEHATPEGRQAFVDEAMTANDPSALTAIVTAASKLHGKVTEPWMDSVFKALEDDRLPESTVTALLADDRARRQDDAASALLFASVAADRAEKLATLQGVSLDAPPAPVQPGVDYTNGQAMPTGNPVGKGDARAGAFVGFEKAPHPYSP